MVIVMFSSCDHPLACGSHLHGALELTAQFSFPARSCSSTILNAFSIDIWGPCHTYTGKPHLGPVWFLVCL